MVFCSAGSVHHKAVIKEYSRSAADMAVPLSHDLRPASVLKTTMDHLLCNVICRIDGDIGRNGMADHYDAVLDGVEASKAGFIFGRIFGGFWGFAPHLDNVTDDPRYSRLLPDFSSVVGNVILTVCFLEKRSF